MEVNGHNVPVAGSLITNESVNDLLDLEETIFEGTRDSEKIKNVLIKIPARPEQKLPVFKAEKYIARKALDLEGRSIDLTNYLNKEKRVVLLGVGGWGKTTELIRITNEIKKTANTFCFFVRLINYSRSLETLLNARCKNWQNVPEDAETYFILDGFDEIDSSKIEEAGHEIENFAAGHSDAHLLVSCRNNFNPFHAIENPDEKKSDEFNVCYLEELSDEDIQKYIEQECLDSASFMSAVKENKSFEILSNPYYLVNTIDIYNSTGRLPETKAAFFDKLIELRIDWERDKKPLTWQNIDEYGLRESLRNLALTMQYAGSFKISQRDFTMIVRKQEIRQTIQKLFFYQEENEWRFEHNNLQEFLAAQYIAELDWEQQKQIILLDNGKLKPKWLNAFSFLVNIAKPSGELIQYFIEKDIDSLVKTEPDKVDRTIRNDVFKGILNKHKAEDSIIWNKTYTEQDLYNFVKLEKNSEVIEFLITELSVENAKQQVISNAVRVLSHLKSSGQYLHKIQPLYLVLLNRNGIHKYGCSREIIQSFSKWKLFSKEVKDQLIATENLYDKDGPLSSLCHYLADGKFDDITGEQVHKLVEAFSEQRFVGSEYSLFDVVRLLSKEELINLIVAETPANNKNRERTWKRDLYEVLGIQAIELYDSDSCVTKAIIDFVYTSYRFHEKEYGKQFKIFFERTEQVESVFKSCFLRDLNNSSNRRREYFIVPALIANQECLDWVIEMYLGGKIPDKLIWYFIGVLSIVENYEKGRVFQEKLSLVAGRKFNDDTSELNSFTTRVEQLEYEILLNRKLAIACVKKAFGFIKRSRISREDLIEIRWSDDNIPKDPELIVGLEFLITHSDNDEEIEKDLFLERLSNEDQWEDIILDKYAYAYSSNNLPRENIEWIVNWCKTNSCKVNFEGSLTKNGDGGYTYDNKTALFVQFAVFFNVEIEENIMLEMTGWMGINKMITSGGGNINDYRVYAYLKKHLNIETLKARIAENIRKESDMIEPVLVEHVEVVKEERWTEAAEYLPHYLNSPYVKRYVRREVLDTYEFLGGDCEMILPSLKLVELGGSDNYYDWNLVDYFVKHKRPEVLEFMKTQVDCPNVDQVKLGIYMMNYGERQGAELILRNLANAQLNERESLQKMVGKMEPENSEFLIDFLTGLFSVYAGGNMGKDGFGSLFPVIFEKFLEIIKRFPQKETVIYSKLDKIFEEIPHNETIGNARYHYYELKERVNIEKDKECTIRQAINELRGMGILNEV
ncbi:NACHT domain-containing protein [Prolixibacter bellariivorans]|uniref:NACHT domain-containing protein n=1 Tax=Prolixibacter bellariivorans TaxID=314319 RepID=UPI001FD5BA90|nr:hypothetical protein [Prolixibacter bellariivorans]